MTLPLTETHEAGYHCGSTSLRDLATHYGWGFSNAHERGLDEATCFGLAGGLGFSYFTLGTDAREMFFGRPLWLERAFFDHLGIETTERRGEDFEPAWAAVRSSLDASQPVLAFVDLFHLDYYDSDTHFAPHAVVLVGYDEETVHIADSEFDAVQTLPLASFRAAWADTTVLPLDNRYIAVEGEPTHTRAEAARRATRHCARAMLDPAAAAYDMHAGTEGIAGIRALADAVPEWTQLPNPRRTARLAYQNVEKRGTGGGAFRGLYTRALRAVGEDAGLPATYAERMAECSAAWSEVGAAWKRAAFAEDETALADHLAEASERLRTIADAEERFFRDALEEL
jgi:hypothetical protein